MFKKLLVLFFFVSLFFTTSKPALASDKCHAEISPASPYITNESISVNITSLDINHSYIVRIAEEGSIYTLYTTPDSEKAKENQAVLQIKLDLSNVARLGKFKPGKYYDLYVEKKALDTLWQCEVGGHTKIFIINAERTCRISPQTAYTGNNITFTFKDEGLKNSQARIIYGFPGKAPEEVNIKEDGLVTRTFSAPDYDISNPDSDPDNPFPPRHYNVYLSNMKPPPDTDNYCATEFVLKPDPPVVKDKDLTDQGCEVEDNDSQCGNLPCGDYEGEFPTHTIFRTTYSCPDGRTEYRCTDLGERPPACGAAEEVAQQVRCPVCPPNAPFYDAVNSACCANNSLSKNRKGQCSNPNIQPTPILCDQGVACKFDGSGCENERGKNLPAPCKSYMTIESNPRDVTSPVLSGTPVPTPYKCVEFDTGVGSFTTDPLGFIKSIFTVLLSLSGGVAMLIIIFSGYRYMTAAGDQAKIQGAKESLTSAIVGLLFIVFSLVILEVIGVDILHIPGLGK